MEAEAALRLGPQAAPVGEGLGEQIERTDDVGSHERRRSIDRPIDVRLCRQMGDHRGGEISEDLANPHRIADVGLGEAVAVASRHRVEGTQIAGVGDLVEIQHLMIGMGDQVADQRRADEPGAPGDQDAFADHGPRSAQTRARSSVEGLKVAALGVLRAANWAWAESSHR